MPLQPSNAHSPRPQQFASPRKPGEQSLLIPTDRSGRRLSKGPKEDEQSGLRVSGCNYAFEGSTTVVFGRTQSSQSRQKYCHLQLKGYPPESLLDSVSNIWVPCEGIRVSHELVRFASNVPRLASSIREPSGGRIPIKQLRQVVCQTVPEYRASECQRLLRYKLGLSLPLLLGRLVPIRAG